MASAGERVIARLQTALAMSAVSVAAGSAAAEAALECLADIDLSGFEARMSTACERLELDEPAGDLLFLAMAPELDMGAAPTRTRRWAARRWPRCASLCHC